MSMYLDIQQPIVIKGESMSPNQNWNEKIEIATMGYDISQTTSQQAGTGLVSSGARVSHLTISKSMDKSTPMLFSYLASGMPLNNMTIRVSRPGAKGGNFGGLYEAETYIFENVVIASYHTSGSPGAGGLPQETWAFSFTKVTEQYQTVDPTGALKPIAPGGYDFGLSVAQ